MALPSHPPASSPGQSRRTIGAYGLRIALLGAAEGAPHLLAADGEAEAWALAVDPAGAAPGGRAAAPEATAGAPSEPASPLARFQEIDCDDARARADFGSGILSLERAPRTACWTPAKGVALDLERITHPVLAAIGLLAANWRGDVALHGGALCSADGSQAWIVLAERGDGKSTTLAAAAAAGLPVLSDDLAVLDGEGCVWSGPRCVDLRPQAAAQFAAARELPADGGRPRWRLPLPAPPARRVPVAGFVRLAWGPAGSAVRSLPAAPAHRLALIAAASAIDRPRWSPRRLLELAQLPVVVIERPQELSSLGAVVEELAALSG